MQSLQLTQSAPEFAMASLSPEPQTTNVAETRGSQVELTAHQNFAAAAERLGLSPDQQLLLRTPFREVKVSVPVQMDDGSLRVFAAIAFSTVVHVGRPRAVFAITRRSMPVRCRHLPRS